MPTDVYRYLGDHLRRAFKADGGDGGVEPFADLLARSELRLTERRRHAADGLRDGPIAAIPALRVRRPRPGHAGARAVEGEPFTPGTHLIAWLFTILRNLFYSGQGKKGRGIEDADGVHAGR